MKDIVNLLKASYQFRKTVKSCLKEDVASKEYQLAKRYDDKFERMDESEHNAENFESFIKQIEIEKMEGENSIKLQQLQTNTISLLNVLKTFV